MLGFVLAVLFLGLRLMSEKGQQIIAGEEADQLADARIKAAERARLARDREEIRWRQEALEQRLNASRGTKGNHHLGGLPPHS